MDRLKVFISSTQSELQSERDRAEQVVLDLGHECVRAETYIAPGTSPENACKQMATSCDVYVGIYGGRYGYQVPLLDVSATELEYREARRVNPAKVLVYVQDVADIEPEQHRFLTEVQDFSSGYFRHAKFSNPDELAEQIRNDLVTWATRQVRQSIMRDIETRALREKLTHMSRLMDIYGVPEHLR